MRIKFAASALVLALALALAQAAPAQTAKLTVFAFVHAGFSQALPGGEAVWVNVTWSAGADARLYAVHLGPFPWQPSDPARFEVHIDGKLAWSGAGEWKDGVYVALIPAENGTLKAGSRTVRVKAVSPAYLDMPFVRLVFALNVSARVEHDGKIASVSASVPAVKGGVSLSLSGSVTGYQLFYLLGVLDSFESDRLLYATQRDPQLVEVLADTGFPAEGYSFTIRLKPLPLEDLAWKYDGAAGLDPSGYRFVLTGTKVSASSMDVPSLVVFANGSSVGGSEWVVGKPGYYELDVAGAAEKAYELGAPVYGRAALVAFKAASTSLRAKDLKVVASVSSSEKPPFSLELAPGPVRAGVRYFSLRVVVPEGAAIVESAEGVRFNGTPVEGIASTVSAEEDEKALLVNYTYKVYKAEGAGLLKAVWGIEELPTVASSTPVIHYVSASKPFVVAADRPLARVLDSAGSDVAFAGGAVAVSAQGTYTVKLVTFLTVRNVYEGKPVEAKVVVKDAKTGYPLASRKGAEVKFELEPGAAYLVESSTDGETLTFRTTLPQDTVHVFQFTKPPEIQIPWELVQTVALLAAVAALIALVVLIKKRGLEITIG